MSAPPPIGAFEFETVADDGGEAVRTVTKTEDRISLSCAMAAAATFCACRKKAAAASESI